MKTKILDSQTLGSLATGDVTSWLRANGWVLTKTEPERYFRFTKGAPEDDFEVDIPFSTALRDHARRMGEVLDVLELAENRSQIELVRDIRHAQMDVTRLQLNCDATRGGRIPLEQGAAFFVQARDMMLAAACAAIEKRPVFSKRKPKQAMDYLRGLKFGPSEEGSYVTTIESPVAPKLQLGLPLLESDTPYERRVMLTLSAALRAMSRAVGEASAGGDISPFVDAVPDGLNSNLCDAIAGMLEPFDSATLAVGFGWAHTRPAPVGPVRVNFAGEVAPVLRTAAKLLKDNNPQPDFEIEGFIVKLESDDPATGGFIVIAGSIDGRMRKVRAKVEAIDYARALEAHGQERQVVLEGDLTREGASLVLRNPRYFGIREEP